MSPAECEELQRNEIQALQSIFCDEFELQDGEAKTVWNKTAVPAFDILVNLRNDDISQSSIPAVLPSVKLHVQYSTLYPRTAPKLDLRQSHGLLKADIELLKKTLDTSIKKLLGAEMIYDLVDILKTQLKTFVQSTNQALSLIDERANRMQESHAIRTALEEDRANLEARMKAEEESAMQSRIEEELRRKSKSRTYSSHAKQERTKVISLSAEVIFSRSISIGLYTFESLSLGVPVVQNDTTVTQPWLTFVPEIGQLIVKQYFIDSARPEILRTIESAVAKNIRPSDKMQEGAIGVQNYGLSLQRSDDTKWTLFIVQEHATKGSLEDLLSIVGHLSNKQAKRWLVDLAEELSAAHRKGMIHRHIHASKVLLFELDGRIAAKFADWEYSYLIHKQDVYFEAKRLALSNQQEPRPSGRRPDDVADLGVVFLEMLFGTSLRTAKSVEQYMKDLEPEMEPNFYAFLMGFFDREMRQRPTASDLLTSEHLRLVDSSALMKSPSHKDTNQISSLSRYHLDFEELSKIGQGGYGTVVKARNRLDGRVYAIKKISTTTESRVLREVSGLARLNHPSIVRYFASWVEHTKTSDRPDDEDDGDEHDDETSSSSSFEFEDDFAEDDFMSSSGIVFATSDSPRNGVEERSTTKSRSRKFLPLLDKVPRMLFIQMEYCSGDTLRLLIDDHHIGQSYWNYFAQIVEGVLYVHGQGLIHRDLKPSNIFISRDGQLKLGDFGLAIESATDPFQGGTSLLSNDERTGDVGTFLYQAPELSLQHPVYDAKVDLYALGIIFGELTCEWNTGMERINILRGLRTSSIINPLNPTRQHKETAILNALLTHEPAMRPTAVQLAAMLPPVVHKNYMKDTLKLLDEDQGFKSSVLADLFSRTSSLIEFTYDVQHHATSSNMSLVTTKVIELLTKLFRRHGAIDRSSTSRTIFPLNEAYKQKSNVVTLLDQEANVLQLPYDLKIPFARHIARNPEPRNKSYIISPVYRSGDPCPRVLLEADFDLIAPKSQLSDDFGIETLRIAHEIVQELPQFDGTTRISLGHSAVLRAILSQAQIALDDMPRVAAMLNQLTSSMKKQSASAWRKSLATVMNETSLQELIKFIPDQSLDFDAGLTRIMSLLGQEVNEDLTNALIQLKSFHASATFYQIDVPIYFQAFPHNSSTFELTYTIEYGNGELLCVGGHYSRLVEKQHLPNHTQMGIAAAGFSLAVDKICRLIASRTDTSDLPRHIDVVVHAYAHEQQAIDLVIRLWDSKIAAEICRDEDLMTFCNGRRALFAISFREKRGNTSTQQVLRVRNLEREESEEVSIDLVVSYLIGEITETEKKHNREISSVPRLLRSASSRKEHEVIIVSTDEHRKMKLPQRQLIANKATELVQDLTNELKDAEIPILIVDLELEQMTHLRSFDPRTQDESSVRKILDKLAAMPRAHFLSVREQIARLQEEGPLTINSHIAPGSFKLEQ